MKNSKITDEEISSLETLIDYLAQDEQENYEERAQENNAEDDEYQEHIYQDVLVLQKLLNRLKKNKDDTPKNKPKGNTAKKTL